MSLPRIFSLFRKRSEEEQRYFEVPAAQRWTMGAMYFGLIAALVVLMYIAQMQLQSIPHLAQSGSRANRVTRLVEAASPNESRRSVS